MNTVTPAAATGCSPPPATAPSGNSVVVVSNRKEEKDDTSVTVCCGSVASSSSAQTIPRSNVSKTKMSEPPPPPPKEFFESVEDCVRENPIPRGTPRIYVLPGLRGAVPSVRGLTDDEIWNQFCRACPPSGASRAAAAASDGSGASLSTKESMASQEAVLLENMPGVQQRPDAAAAHSLGSLGQHPLSSSGFGMLLETESQDKAQIAGLSGRALDAAGEVPGNQSVEDNEPQPLREASSDVARVEDGTEDTSHHPPGETKPAAEDLTVESDTKPAAKKQKKGKDVKIRILLFTESAAPGCCGASEGIAEK